MQLSMDPRYPGYKPDNWELDVTLWLDGVQQRRCIALDTEARTMVILSPDHGPITYEGHVEVKCGQSGKELAKSPTVAPKEAKVNGPRNTNFQSRGSGKSGRWKR